MRLSQHWTAINFFKTAFRDIGYDPNSPINAERYAIINESVNKVHSLIKGLTIGSYLTTMIASEANDDNYSTGTGTYDGSTKRITISAMYQNFLSEDIGKLVMFRIDNKVYSAFIADVVSTTVIELSGNGLLTADRYTVSTLLVASVITGDEILLTDIPIDRTGSTVGLVVESSSAKLVTAYSPEMFRYFAPATLDNRKRVVYCLQENKILLKKGDLLETYGTLTVRYPRLPLPVSIDSHKLDLPDGLPCEIAMLRTKITIAIRHGKPELVQPYYQEMYALIEGLYRSFGQTMDMEAIKEKIRAIV